MTDPPLDDVDRTIIELLVRDGRRTIRDIAKHVCLSPAPVQRRLQRLERTGVIAGYTAIIRHDKVGPCLEAFTELRYAGDVDIDDIFRSLIDEPEVLAVYTTAGSADALVQLRVRDASHLQSVINRLRRRGRVTDTRTRIVLERKEGGAHPHPSRLSSMSR